MALEDYKIDNNAVMCGTPDGRGNTYIQPDDLENNRVSTILPQIEEGQIIRGLLLDSTSGFQRFARINGSLYSMSVEVEKAIKAAKRAQGKSSISPLSYDLKNYLKSEGFVGDSGAVAYEAPTNNLPQNQLSSIGGRSYGDSHLEIIERCEVRVFLKENKFEMLQAPEEFYYDPLKELLGVTVQIKDKKNLIHYEISEKDVERFKADGTAYKNSIASRLKNFAQDLSSLAQEYSKDINEIKNQGFIEEVDDHQYYKISKQSWEITPLVAKIRSPYEITPDDPARYVVEFRFKYPNGNFYSRSSFTKELESLPAGFLDQFRDKKFFTVSEAIKYAEDSLALGDNSVSKMKTRSSVDLESLNTEKTNTILEALHTLRKMDVE